MSMPEPARLGRHEDWAGDIDDESDCAADRSSFIFAVLVRVAKAWCP